MRTNRPNWVEKATLAVAAITGIIAAYAAIQSSRIDELERQLQDFRARGEVESRLVILDQINSCGLHNRFRVQENQVAETFQENFCGPESSYSSGRLAGLALSTPVLGEVIFTPRVSISLTPSEGVVGELVSNLDGKGTPQIHSIGFIEDGSEFPIFIPLAIIDDDGRLVTREYVFPNSISWVSPVTSEEYRVPLNWFAPREQWISSDAIIYAQ